MWPQSATAKLVSINERVQWRETGPGMLVLVGF
jgi:hypothetical protein